MIWHIICESVEDFYDQTNYAENPNLFNNNFIVSYELYEDSISEITVKVWYFSFTSLSTVGFGDFHAINNVERLACAMMLIFGVAIFSYFMG